MNRSTFHTRLARATVAVVLAVSAIGCATAPEPTPLPEIPDVSLQSPAADLPEPSASRLEEPSPVWIDDTIARRTAVQPTELAVQPPLPELDVRTAIGRSPAPAAGAAPRAPTSAVAPTTLDPVAADPIPDEPLALIAPRVPALERPETVENASPTVADASPATTAGSAPLAPTLSAGSARLAPTLSAAPSDSAAASASNQNPVAVSNASPASSTTRDAPTRSTPSWTERAATVASEREFSVVLPGSGWLYVGKEYGDGEIRLLGKSRSAGDEVFRFRMGEPGDYGLWFQQQDSLSGSLMNERLSVRAAEDVEATTVTLANLPVGSTLPTASAVATPATSFERASDAVGRVSSGARSGTATAATDDGSAVGGTDADRQAAAPEPRSPDALDRAQRLLDAGEGAEALAAFADGAGRGLIDIVAIDSSLVDRFVEAARSAAGEEVPSAVIRSFWRAVASSGSAAAPDARRALLEIAARAGDADEVAAAVSALESAGEASAEDMARAADALFGAGREAEALPLLARAVTRDEAAIEGVDRLDDDRIIALARLFEQPGPDRDLRRAASLYRLIRDDRPLSGYWDESRSRLEYLRRHYFEVR